MTNTEQTASVVCLKSNAARCPHLGALVIILGETLGRIKTDSSALGNDADTLPLLSVGINGCFGRILRCPLKVQLQALGT